MVGSRSAAILLWLTMTACSGADIELGGGRLMDDAQLADGGARWDGSDERWRASGDNNGDGRRNDWSSSSGDEGGGSGGAGSNGDRHWDDAGRCDPGGPYCSADGRVFTSECEADREGARDATYCPWAEP